MAVGAEYVTTALQRGAAVPTVIGEGQEMPGGVTSTRFTLKLQLAVRPASSMSVSVTVVDPTPETAVPAAGDWVTVGAEQLSVAVARVV